jgi:hypothetical protein
MAEVSKNASMEQHKASQEGLGIGRLVEGEQHRDAIHVAIVPVTAGERLHPGQHIGVENGVAWFQKVDTQAIGIVDPFFSGPVLKGERFWLFLYPGSITSLRHVWTHPALSDEIGAAKPQQASGKEASEKWMRAWAVQHMGDDYYGEGPRDEDAAYASAIYAGENNSVGPYEEARDHIDNEWWEHWETITGQEGDRSAYFSCAC